MKYYLNTIYKSLPGERWKAVRNYEDYYEVSNYGRVRSIDRYVPHPRHGEQFVKGRILNQKIIRHRNIKTNVPSIDLQVAFSRDGKLHYFNVRRLVYDAFIKPIEYEKDGLYVINKNGNGLNCTANNLKLVTKKEKSIRSFKRGRVVESYLKYADRSKWKKPYGGATRRKPVLKLNMDGKVLKKYKSVSEASQKTGLDEKAIIGVAKGRWSQWNGFKWKYAEN